MHDVERAYLNIAFGFPASDCEVPNIRRKPVDEMLKEYQKSILSVTCCNSGIYKTQRCFWLKLST